MDKNLNERLQEYKEKKLTNKENPMSESQETPVETTTTVSDVHTESTTTKPAIDPAAQGYKVGGTESNTKADDKKEKTSWVELAKAPFKFAYEKAILPTWNFLTGVGTKAYDKVVTFGKDEMELAKSLGFLKYVLDRLGTLALKASKLTVVITLGFIINSFMMQYIGISLFNPYFVLGSLILGICCVAGKSIWDQKDQNDGKGSVSAKVVGGHIVESLMAA